jgi:hypothetical protein
MIVLTALSLALGWGIRGNYGHEYGAMIPGALAAMAMVLFSGRADWLRRIVYFAMYGALGWSFGGSMSYMQVVAYTHSGHSVSVLYGFACLFLIGFFWAALGGAGTALPAVADHAFLASLGGPVSVVFVLWWLQGLVVAPWLRHQGYSLNWHDTDWLAAALALLAVVIVAAARRRLDSATSLVLHLAAGWWAGYLVLVVVLDLHMTPPRGDNWAGCAGMTAGLFWYCRRARLSELARAALVSGFIGGIGFAAASMLKLAEVTSGYQTNWHSIMEQTTGLFNGIGVAFACIGLAKRAPRADSAGPRSWAAPLALGFVVLGITYLNLRKNVAQWLAARAVPETMVGIAARVWFDFGYILVALTFLILVLRHRQRPLAILPESWLGKGQLLYAGLLWWLVVGNFARILVAFTPERLVTEGIILVVALACTIIAILWSDSTGVPEDRAPEQVQSNGWSRLGPRALVVLGVTAAILSIALDWAIVRMIYGDRFAGHANLHIRFGPRATINRPEQR